jgi:Protein of unknown function (DUF4238)
MANIPVKHHYVARCLIANFNVKGKPNQVHVFDKHRGNAFTSSLKDAGSENDFNTVELNGVKVNFEPLFQDVDDLTANVTRKLIKTESLAALSDEERVCLSIITAAQLLRTKLQRTSPAELAQQLNERLRSSGLDQYGVPYLDAQSENDGRLFSLQQLIQLEEYTEPFLAKDLLLLRTSEARPFLISDNPVVLHNTFPYGEIGLNARGIEIYFPVSKNLCLAFYCPSIRLKLGNAFGSKETKLGADAGWLERVYYGLNSMEAVDAIESTVDFVNELQIRSSSRFLYGSDGDFSFARRILERTLEARNVRSLYGVSMIGMPPTPREGFPPGEYLVVYGARDHHMLAIKDLSDADEDGGILFITTDLEKLRVIQQDSPFEVVYVYREGQAVRMIRDSEFGEVDYTGARPIRVKAVSDGVNQLLALIHKQR